MGPRDAFRSLATTFSLVKGLLGQLYPSQSSYPGRHPGAKRLQTEALGHECSLLSAITPLPLPGLISLVLRVRGHHWFCSCVGPTTKGVQLCGPHHQGNLLLARATMLQGGGGVCHSGKPADGDPLPKNSLLHLGTSLPALAGKVVACRLEAADDGVEGGQLFFPSALWPFGQLCMQQTEGEAQKAASCQQAPQLAGCSLLIRSTSFASLLPSPSQAWQKGLRRWWVGWEGQSKAPVAYKAFTASALSFKFLPRINPEISGKSRRRNAVSVCGLGENKGSLLHTQTKERGRFHQLAVFRAPRPRHPHHTRPVFRRQCR